MQTGSIMERTCLFFYVMLYLLFYFEAEKVKKDVKTSIYLIKMCYETCFFSWKVCQCPKSPYLCNVFFIVLDLRLTKVGVQRYSFFYVHMSAFGEKNYQVYVIVPCLSFRSCPLFITFVPLNKIANDSLYCRKALCGA